MGYGLIAQDTFASGSLASGWVVLPTIGFSQVVGSPFVAESSAVNITSGQLWTGVTFPNDQSSEATVGFLNTNSLDTVGLAVRFSTSVVTGYLAIAAGNGYLSISRFDNGTQNILFQNNGYTWSSGDVLTFKVSGSTLTYYQNGILLTTQTDATYASGAPGFDQNCETTTSNSQISSWRGYGTIWSISGNVGIAGASVVYSGPMSGSVVADSLGNYTINGLLNGSYVIMPSAIGYSFSPASQNQTVSGADLTSVNFVATATVYSVPDCRLNPNIGVLIQGTVFYTGQTSDNAAIPPADCRKAGAPVDCRINKPINCRTYPPFD